MDDIQKIRNIGIIAHIDAGKTTTTEGLLYYSGLSHRYGSIDDGTTIMDFLPEERTRGITIMAAAATLPWGEHLIHLIDTPGHIDFTAEVERSLRVMDGAVVVFSGVEGVEAQSEKVWRQADGYGVPKIAFINKLDRIGASFARVQSEINEKFGNCAVSVQAPVGIEEEFHAILDLVDEELITFSGENNAEVKREPIPQDLEEEANALREEMIERLADASDAIAMAYLEGDTLDSDTLKSEIRRLTILREIVPVLLGSGKKHIGIQPLGAAVIDYLPSPLDVGAVSAMPVRGREGETVDLLPDPEKPFAGLIFKVTASSTSDLFYMRTYTGTLKANSQLVNARTGAKVRAKQVFKIYAKSTEAMEEVGPGDIVGLVGLKNCSIGDTLCEPRQVVTLEQIKFPEPVISMAVEPRLSKDKDKLDEALSMLCREDQTFGVTRDEDTGQRLVSGMGELHLEINVKRLAEQFGLNVRVGEPRVAYRETFCGQTTERVVFERAIGETELYAEVEVAFKPLSRGEELFSVENRLRGAKAIPKALVACAEKALADGLRTGGNHGYPLIYLSAQLNDLKVQTGKTTEGAIVGAVLQSIDQAINRVGTTVLEPVMRLEILGPEETVGEVSMYLQPRRAIIHNIVLVNEARKITVEVPLGEMFGFGKSLPRLTGGRGSFSMEPCGYQEVPADVAKTLFGIR